MHLEHLDDPAPASVDPYMDPARATKQDWIDLIGVYRVVVRARTGWRFASLEWA